MLYDKNVEMSALSHCWNNPPFTTMLTNKMFHEPMHKFLHNILYNIVTHNERRDKFTLLIINEYLTQNEEHLLETLGNKEEHLYYSLDSFIQLNYNYLETYNFKEEDYILNKLAEYAHKREAHDYLVSAANDLEKNKTSLNEILGNIQNLEPVTAERILNFWDSLDRASEDSSEYIKFNDPVFDHTFKSRSICTVYADTGCLKTAFTLWLTLKFLEANPDKTAMYFEKEMPREDIVDRVICYYCKIDNTSLLRDKKKYYAMMKAEYGSSRIDSNVNVNDILERLYILTSDEFDTAEDVVKYVRYYKPDLWVLDYMTQLNQRSRIAKADFNSLVMTNANLLKALTQYGHPTMGIIIAQINKNSIGGRRNKIPELIDMEWSNTLPHISSQCIALFKPDVYYQTSPANAFIGVFKKQRVGKPSDNTIFLNADAAQNNFSSKETGHIKTWYSNYLSNMERS